MPFVYRRVIRFAETDAAGVVYFAALLNLCHEAYEEAIASTQTTPAINPRAFFSGAADTAMPIVHTAADFYQPLFCGDRVFITLTPKLLTPHSFEISYIVRKADRKQTNLSPLDSADLRRVKDLSKSDRSKLDRSKLENIAKALTRHVCISTQSRRKTELPSALLSWIAALAEPEPAE